MFPYHKKSDAMQRKCDIAFQIIFSIFYNVEEVPLLLVFVVQAVYDVSRSKKLIKIINHLGIFINYHGMLHMNTLLATKLIQTLDNIGFLSLKRSRQTQSFMWLWIS